MNIQNIKLTHIQWGPIWRIIPSIYPTIDLFERVADPEDYESIYEIENMTNDRIRDNDGLIKLVSPEQKVKGPGSSYIMAAFTHLNPEGSRFSDGSYGVFYGAHKYSTAIAESKYHRAKFLSDTQQDPIGLHMRVMKAKLNAHLHDIRCEQKKYAGVYDLNDYTLSKQFASQLRSRDASGITYSSVRCEKQGDCAAIFHPNTLSNCREDHHLFYSWNGKEIVEVYKKLNIEEQQYKND